MNDKKVGSIYAAVERKSPEVLDLSGALVFDEDGEYVVGWGRKTISFKIQEGDENQLKFLLLVAAGADIHDLGPHQIVLLDRAAFDKLRRETFAVQERSSVDHDDGRFLPADMFGED